MIELTSVKRPNFNIAVRHEADAVLTSASFRKSPVLSRLLRYLVEQTVLEQADALKSFTVAVDGLGRPASFDPASDSSARVQMVRLRKALESHYAQHGPTGEQCIYLQPGSYRVRMGALAVAYPMLYRPLSDPGPKQSAPEIGSPLTSSTAPFGVPALASAETAIPKRRRDWLLGIGILAGITVTILGWSIWQRVASSRISTNSPILELLPADSADTPEQVQMSRLVSSTFADNLPRFKLSRVRLVGSAGDAAMPDITDNVYRLSSRLADDMQGGQKLFLNLSDARTNTAFWSREVALPRGETPSGALVPLLAEINGPFGVVATYGSAIYRDNASGGYPCLLKYYEFVQTREIGIESKVAKCFEKPVKEARLQAPILASRAFFAIERRSAASNFAAASKQGIIFARAAVAADPNDGSANFALARLSYLENDCVSARFYTQRALESNPVSPLITATLAALANVCDYPEADKLLEQAFLAQSPRFAKGRVLLTIAALAQDRPDKIALVEQSDMPHSRYNRVNYYLAETLIAASQGRRSDAARNWALYSEYIPPGSRTPDEKLRSLIAHPAMRRKVIELLENGGAFGNSAKK